MSNQQKPGDKPATEGPRQEQANQDQGQHDRGRTERQQDFSRRDWASFVVEFSDDHCRNFTITTPPLAGHDVRGRWDTSKMAQRPQGMRDLGNAGNRIPSQIPGARLAVDVRRKKISLFDPLGETAAGREVLAKFNAVIKGEGMQALRRGQDEFKPFPTVEFDVDDDQLKTLLFELRRKWDSKCLIMVEGELPTVQQIESLGGDELYDPSNPSDEKPRYKKDLPAWKDKMRAAGV